jgi:hypothetical protein
VGPRSGLDYAENRKFLPSPGLELLPLCRPARSQSLYRPRYCVEVSEEKTKYAYGYKSISCHKNTEQNSDTKMINLEIMSDTGNKSKKKKR